jgi:hypothetical protein
LYSSALGLEKEREREREKERICAEQIGGETKGICPSHLGINFKLPTVMRRVGPNMTRHLKGDLDRGV